MNKDDYIIYFSNTLKSNDLQLITQLLSKKDDVITKHEKIDLVISNLCFLKIPIIQTIIEQMKLKPHYGKIPMYIQAIKCSPEIFGFISSYFTLSKALKDNAYYNAAKLNRIDILKKIRGIDKERLKIINDYVQISDKFTDEIKRYIRLDYKKAKAKKDSSPEDQLKSQFKSKKFYM